MCREPSWQCIIILIGWIYHENNYIDKRIYGANLTCYVFLLRIILEHLYIVQKQSTYHNHSIWFLFSRSLPLYTRVIYLEPETQAYSTSKDCFIAISISPSFSMFLLIRKGMKSDFPFYAITATSFRQLIPAYVKHIKERGTTFGLSFEVKSFNRSGVQLNLVFCW